MPSIHSRIRERRKALGLSQEALAEMVGVTYQSVQQWEREPVETDDAQVQSTAPKRTRLEKVAKALKCTPEWLLTGATTSPDEVDPEEAMYLDMMRKLPDAVREVVRSQITSLYNALNPGHPHRVDPTGGKKPPE
jgi:transcriptional regulator with XRE-family HTH domain